MTRRWVSSLFVLVLTLTVLLGGPAQSQGLSADEATLAEVDRYLGDQREEQGWPGLAVGIVADGRSVMLEGYGVAEPGGEPIDEHSVFLIASLSKSITALAVMQLVEEGFVELDAPISDYLDVLKPGGNDVTVADILYQSSGLDRYTGNVAFVKPFGDSLETNVERLGPLLRDGARFEYSNANYDILARLVEVVSGQEFPLYIEEHVFSPLGMDESFVGPPDEESIAVQGHYHNLLLGYRPHTPAMRPGTSGSYLMFSSAADLTRLMLLHLDGSPGVISSEGLATLHSGRPYSPDAVIRYGGGLSVEPPGMPGLPDSLVEYTTLRHNGDAASYKSNLWMIPEAGLGVVLLVNAHDETNPAPLDLVAQNVRLILAGEDTFALENPSDFLLRWSKVLMLLLVAGQLTLAVMTIRSLRQRALRWSLIIPATALDALSAVTLFYLIPTVGDTPLGGPFSLPDYRWLIIGMAVGIIWGVARSVIVLAIVMRRSSPAT